MCPLHIFSYHSGRFVYEEKLRGATTWAMVVYDNSNVNKTYVNTTDHTR